MLPPRTGYQIGHDNIPHPSTGYGKPYSQDCRELVMAINKIADANPLHPAVIDLLETLQQMHVYPHINTQTR